MNIVEVEYDPTRTPPRELDGTWATVRLCYVDSESLRKLASSAPFFVPTSLPLAILEQVINDAAQLGSPVVDRVPADLDSEDDASALASTEVR